MVEVLASYPSPLLDSRIKVKAKFIPRVIAFPTQCKYTSSTPALSTLSHCLIWAFFVTNFGFDYEIKKWYFIETVRTLKFDLFVMNMSFLRWKGLAVGRFFI